MPTKLDRDVSDHADTIMAEMNAKAGMKLSNEQESAVELCADFAHTIVGVTGEAGTGKTSVLGEAYRVASQQRKAVLCAPTGRAAKRVSELTGISAKTVHRLLEFPMPDEMDTEPNQPKRCRDKPLDEKCVFVDESSMLSPTLFRQLMDALPRDGVVRFFGDNNQLPPVEEGIPPFIDVLERFPSVVLTYNYRSDDEIVGNARRILAGRMPVRNPRFEIIYRNDPVKFLIDWIKDIPEFARHDYQVIMPTRKGQFGTMRVNPSLQVAFNPRGPMLRLDRFDDKEAPLAVRAGDKFLWIKNDYKLNLFNGEIGRIDWVDEEDGSIGLITPERSITVPARVKTYSPYFGHVIDYDPRKQIELGYGITTHKSQGSEFKTIVYCMCRKQAYLLDRRNFYTGITRAKQNVIIVTDTAAMGMSLRKKRLG